MDTANNEAASLDWQPTKAALIVNTRSRTGERVFFEALDRLHALGISIGATYALRDPARLAETVPFSRMVMTW